MASLSESDLEALPHPVAHPLALARDAQLPGLERMDQAFFAAYQAMRLSTLLLLADFLDVEGPDREVDEAVRGLRLGTWQQWAELADALARFWEGESEGRPGRAPRFPALVQGWNATREENAALATARLAHARHRPPDAAGLPALLARVEALCLAAVPPGAVQLLRRVTAEPLSAQFLEGPGILKDFAASPVDGPAAALLGASEVVAVSGGAALGVSPLLVAGTAEPLLMLDGLRERKLLLLGVKGGEETPRHFASLSALLSRKRPFPATHRAGVTRGAVAARARTTARQELAARRGARHEPACHVERRGLESAVEAALERGGCGLLLLGEAGRGKSSLLARKVEALTAEPGGDVVAYLCGRPAYAGEATWSGPRLLCEAVLRKLGVEPGAFADLEDLLAHLDAAAAPGAPDRRVWLVLDGLDEADRFPEWVKAVDALLPATARYPWLRLVTSCRTGAYASLERHGRVFAHEQHLFPFFDEREQRDKPYLGLRPFDRAEAASAYARRAAALPGSACPVPWGVLPAEVRELLRHPLHLRLFHEAFAGRLDVPASLDERGLLRAWAERQCAELPGLADALDRLAAFQFERARPQWLVEHVEEWASAAWERGGSRAVDRVARLDPVELLTSTSLMLPAREGVGAARRVTALGYVHQRLGEMVLLRELERQAAPRVELDETDLARQAEYAAWHPEFHEYQEALTSVVLRATREGREGVMALLPGLPQDGLRHRWLEAALRTIGLHWGGQQEGREGPRRALAALVAAAKKGPRGRDRLLAVAGVTGWLEDRQCAWGALAVSASRLELLPADDSRALSHSGLLARVGRAEQRAGRTAEARGCFEASLALRRALVGRQPSNLEFQAALASALSRLAGHAESEGRLAEARALYEEGLGWDRQLLEAEPSRDELRTNLAVALSSLAQACEQLGARDEARARVEEAVALDRALCAKHPGHPGHAEHLASRLARLGALELESGRVAQARAALQESLTVRRGLLASEPGAPGRTASVVRALDRLARLEESERRFDEARALDAEVLQRERALSAAGQDRARELSSALARAGNLELAAGRVAEARGHFEASLALRRGLVEAHPGDPELAGALSRALDRLGALEEAVGRGAGARAWFAEALALDRASAAAWPDRAEVLLGLAASLVRWSKALLKSGQLPTGEAAQAMELLRRVHALDPSDATVAQQLGDALCTFARCCPGEGGAPWRSEGLALLHAAAAASPRNAEYAEDLREALAAG